MVHLILVHSKFPQSNFKQHLDAFWEFHKPYVLHRALFIAISTIEFKLPAAQRTSIHKTDRFEPPVQLNPELKFPSNPITSNETCIIELDSRANWKLVSFNHESRGQEVNRVFHSFNCNLMLHISPDSLILLLFFCVLLDMHVVCKKM